MRGVGDAMCTQQAFDGIAEVAIEPCCDERRDDDVEGDDKHAQNNADGQGRPREDTSGASHSPWDRPASLPEQSAFRGSR